MKYYYLKNGQTLQIDEARCIGCGACIEVCPHAVFGLAGSPPLRRAQVLDRHACMECGACAKNCPVAAITVASGVGCAAAVLQSLKTGGSPECGCGEGSGCCN
jgi:NAD-dependent dihydropyrimidine dehydrogenase PreA subunit